MRLLALLTIVLASAVVVGCDSIDPTEQSFPVTFKNDTRQSVHLKLCADSGCQHFDYSDAWRAGQSSGEGISDRDVLTRWLVEDATGRVLGCIPLEFDQKYPHVVVRISQMVRCPGSAPLLIVSKGNGQGQS